MVGKRGKKVQAVGSWSLLGSDFMTVTEGRFQSCLQ